MTKNDKNNGQCSGSHRKLPGNDEQDDDAGDDRHNRHNRFRQLHKQAGGRRRVMTQAKKNSEGLVYLSYSFSANFHLFFLLCLVNNPFSHTDVLRNSRSR